MVAASRPNEALPEQLQDRFNAIMEKRLQRLAKDDVSDEEAIEPLSVFVSQRASRALELSGLVTAEDISDVTALRLLQRQSQKASVPLQLILDAVIAYPHRAPLMEEIISAQMRIHPKLLEDLGSQVLEPLLAKLLNPATAPASIPATAYILLALARSYNGISDRLMQQPSCLKSLQRGYSRLNGSVSDLAQNFVVQAKSHLLLLLHTLLSSLRQADREWKLITLVDEDEAKPARRRGIEAKPLKDASLAEDYVMFFTEEHGQTSAAVPEETLRVLKDLRAVSKEPIERSTKAADEARVAPLLALFPQLPPHLVISALQHPRFSAPPTATSDPAIEELTNALLEDSLPAELVELSRALRASAPTAETFEPERARVDGSNRRIKRDNIFDEMPMDFSKLKVGKDSADMPSLTAGIPDHIRESILRLSQQQADEEDEEMRLEREEAAERRARAKSHGATASANDAANQLRTAAFEDEMDEDGDYELGGGRATGRGVVADGEESDDGSDVLVRGVDEDDEPEVDNSPETICEVAYLRDPKQFDRDSSTRRSKARADLKTQTGWTDEQLEGWRIMLEKNPRKDKILERHAFGIGSATPRNRGVSPPPPQHQGERGGYGGRGGGRGGERGGGRGGGGSRGRGSSKSSRGHQNATRTRGHDKKMQRMGGGGGI